MGMHYKNSEGQHCHHNVSRRASCSRFCRNVCGQFSSGREQCFKDCKACQNKEEVEAEETQPKYACIRVEAIKTSCENCGEVEAAEEEKDCGCW